MKSSVQRRALRRRLLSLMIRYSVPSLNLFRYPPAWPYSLEALSHYPSGSWGVELAHFLQSRHLEFLPKYETHDAWHVLLGYDTNVPGELRLQAFMFGNRSASFAGRVLLLLGMLLMPELWLQCRHDFARGRNSPRLAEWDIPSLLSCSLKTLTAQIAS
ncbi:MAG: hypothetical protein ACRDH2_02375 [Anaerolineales bacterium]